ncbi:uncharacterized protein OCT59_020140 [Rhizophagus irregularis]|uniref:Kelch-like protein 17 n=2 Tax=Rhizophagus irregularis TaxID=588596 RepID=A0A015KFN8_RHIIW|nr:hypothetical protein RirG_198010 [Rhizophagus irregularis DAOM 197198w]UZO01628.1 hypothetical protein OCT59_020140 [Rhizophagus irregularis]
MVVKNLLPRLSQDFLKILNDEEYYDITIEVGNEDCTRVFRAHKVILYYRSPYLQRILSTDKKKNDGTLAHIKLPNILPEIFQIILSYLYGGKLSLDEYDTSDVMKILDAASELNLQELFTYLQSFLIRNKTNWMEQNFNLIYQMSFENDSFAEFKNYCNDLITKEPNKIFETTNFSSISENLLVTIIQSDNLQMNEIQIWEHVLNWGLAKNPELPSDPATYSKQNFKTLKNTLQHCIPLIEFHNLSSREFVDKVLPYEKVFPKDIYRDLIKSFLNLLNPDSRPNGSSDRPRPCNIRESEKIVGSRIITQQHVELISKWIDRLEITDQLIPSYEFKLLFSGSRDGLDRDKFHEICDNKLRTVTIVKVKGSNEILGGYNPLEWKSNGNYGITKDSFIFSFNSNRINNYILSRIMNKNNAIKNHFYYGPSFGENDLVIWSSSFGNYCKRSSYLKPIRQTKNKFDVEECEVFQIIHNEPIDSNN